MKWQEVYKDLEGLVKGKWRFEEVEVDLWGKLMEYVVKGGEWIERREKVDMNCGGG